MKEVSFIEKAQTIFREEGLRGYVRRLRNRITVNLPIRISIKSFKELYKISLLQAAGQPGSEYVPITDSSIDTNDIAAKLIAFYLTQFHPIPENDQWWGRGFTEWTNVSKAVPQFLGHYQPHLPGELGFYDLRLPEVMERQIELARMYGVYGFAFYYYWFNGKRLLEKPLDSFLSSQNDFPFCLCWANENWTRRWDGQESDLLIGQDHSPESDLQFIKDIHSVLQDKRYIRVNGRPLLLVYRPDIIPNVKETVHLWREYCRENQLGDPYLVAAQTFFFTNPFEVGFDAAVEFPPHNLAATDIRHTVKMLNEKYEGNIVDYDEIKDHFSNLPRPDYPLYKTVFPSWDNEARKPERGYTFANSSPEKYKEWLKSSIKFAAQEENPDNRIVFINAWNEWAEGAHLEPDRKHGYGYLQATTNALKETSHLKGVETSPVVVFQSGKVASTSVQISIENAYAEMGLKVPVYHAHILEDIDQRIEYVQRLRKNPADTVAKLEESKSLRKLINASPERVWKIINLVRDPVAQKISAVFQLLNEYIPDWKKQNPDSVLESIQNILLTHEEFAPENLDQWYDAQIRSIWNLDVFTLPSPKSHGYEFYKTGNTHLLIVRLEDLGRVSESAFKDFLGIQSIKIVNTNAGSQKEYHQIYEAFKKRPIPASYLSKVYSTRYARHFYTQPEIQAFENKWLRPSN